MIIVFPTMPMTMHRK